MTHDEPVAAAGKTSIGDQRDILAETFAHDRTRRGKHLAHAGSADRAFVANHDHVTGFHAALQNGVERDLLALEHDRFAAEREAFLAGNFGDGPLWREI